MAMERGKELAEVLGVEPALAERVLSFVSEHPGSKLTAIEERLGISRIEAGRIIRDLMEQGKVRRDEVTREYYPI